MWRKSFPMWPIATLAILNAIQTIEGDLKISGHQCGTRTCPPEQYCSVFISACDECRHICDEQSHNFDMTLCDLHCQDYIHNKFYTNRASDGSESELKAVKTLEILIAISFVVHLFLIVAVVFLCQKRAPKPLCRKIRSFFNGYNIRKNKQQDVESNHAMAMKTAKLRLDMPQRSVQGDSCEMNFSNSPGTCSTAISSRGLPSQDRVEFAYDNPAMTNVTRISTSTMDSSREGGVGGQEK